MSKKISIAMYSILIFTISILFTGCSKDVAESLLESGNINKTPFKIKVAAFGEIYEAPLYAAVDKGFFGDEGIDAELVKTDFDTFKNVFSKSTFDGATCDFRIFKAIEQGTDIKLVAGLHGGCTQIIVNRDSSIKSVKDLKNKTIGVEASGNGPMTISSALLQNNDIDPVNAVKWKVYPSDKLQKALADREVDAVSILEPAEGNENGFENGFRVVFSSSEGSSKKHTHGSSQHFYGSFIGISDEFISGDKEKAAYITRSWLKAARWVSENPEEAVRLSVDNKYVSGGFEYNYNLFKYYMWSPGVIYAKNNIDIYIRQQKKQGILNPDLNVKSFLNDIYVKVLPDFNG